MENTTAFQQDVINESNEIFERITAELEKANYQILIASAWFTDPELFLLVKKKSLEGVKIDLIIADNEENRKLNFNELVSAGGQVIRIKNVGYGMMHQKFCVIDSKVAIHGSYNWSVNARKNNHESIIVTTHVQTILSLIEVFNNIKNKANEKKNAPEKGIKGMFNNFLGKNKKDDSEEDLSELAKLDKILQDSIEKNKEVVAAPSVEDSTYLKFERVLDSMIAAEVSGFDRPMLRNQGFERCKLNNGDSQVLDNALDSVYSVFINDIDVIDDKKKRLIGKIHEQKVITNDYLQTNLDLQLNKIEKDHEDNKTSFFQKIINYNSDIGALDVEIKSILNNKIDPLNQKILNIRSEIKEKEREFIIPKHKKFELIPNLVVNTILLLYLILFYSSAAYILIFAENDARLANLGGKTEIPGVFDPYALSAAWDKGSSMIFILLFSFLPICIALTEWFQIVSEKKSQWISYVGIILIDIFLAIQLSKSIHNVRYEANQISTPWNLGDVYLDINAYLVLVMGAAGLLIFKVTFKKLMRLFEERNPDIHYQKNLLIIKHHKDDILELETLIQNLRLEVDDKQKQIVQIKADTVLHEAELENLPILKANLVEKRKTEYHSKVLNVSQITDIYISHVENDNLPISVDSLRDRINIFLEGWNDYLNSEFAIPKAVDKTFQAAEIASKWLSQKLVLNQLDKRIKL